MLRSGTVRPQYHRNLQDIAIGDFSKELELASMIPSRKNLGVDIPDRLKCLGDHGIENLSDLLAELKTPKKLKAFARTTGLPEDYLVNFRRELGSIRPKPVKLGAFPSLDAADIMKLKEEGITDTRQMFDNAATGDQRRALGSRTGIPEERLLEIAKLSDVSRIKWVGANFARVLVDSGYDTAENVAKADHRQLYEAVIAVNEKKHYYKGKIGKNDMKLCVLAAGNVPPGIVLS